MPKRISADVDMEILQAIAQGTKHTTIAETYNVSTSYVSKLNTGKKVPDIYVPTPPSTEQIVGDTALIESALRFIETRPVADKETCKKYFNKKAREHILLAKIYFEAAKGIK
jgi:hypothetical protein